jgi:hypothetical protein
VALAFGRYLVFDGEYIWKYTHKAYDFSVLGDSPIAFPIEWDRSKIPGYAFRVSVPNWHGLTAFVVMSRVAARFFEPEVSGIGAAPVGSERACDSDHANQSEWTVSGIGVWLEPGKNTGGWHGERRPQSAAHSTPRPVRDGRGSRQSF